MIKHDMSQKISVSPTVLLNIFLWTLLAIFSQPVKSQTLPAEGVYIRVRWDLMQQIGEALSLELADIANTYSGTPPQNGETDEVTYTLSNFLYDVDLEQFFYSTSGSPFVSAGWKSFRFMIQFNYHVCTKVWPHPCESGWIVVYTTTQNVELLVNWKVDLTQPTIQVTALSAQLFFQRNDIGFHVQCTDVICIIPTFVIETAVALNFVKDFTAAIVTMGNSAAKSVFNNIPTSLYFPQYQLDVSLKGGFDAFPLGALNGNLVLYAIGTFSPGDGTKYHPPYTPTTQIPDSFFQSPGSEIEIFVTDYLVKTALWSLNFDNYFNVVITDGELPPNSPVRLRTDDRWMQSAVPALKKFPSMFIDVTLSMRPQSSAHFTTSGLVLNLLFDTSWVLRNATKQFNGWQLLVTLNPTVKFTVYASPASYFRVNVSFVSWSTNVSLAGSHLGPVNVDIFKFLLNAAVLQVPAQSFVIPSTSYFTFSASNVAVYENFALIPMNAQFNIFPISARCPDGKLCPMQNTCCLWNSSYGCCNLPNAVCCSQGCCPHGTRCTPNNTCE